MRKLNCNNVSLQMFFHLQYWILVSKNPFVSERFGVQHLCPALESNLNGKLMPSACRPLQQRLVYKLSGFSENGLTISKDKKGKKLQRRKNMDILCF